MSVLWGISGFLPLILYGLIIYGLFWKLPKWLRSRSRRNPKRVTLSNIGQTEAPGFDASRKRTIATFSAPAPQGTEPAITAETGARGREKSGGQDLVLETVSVVLRRQIPPRFDMPARSWIGGLPQMPEAIDWPRSISAESPEQGERPLNFVAQICCADLPPELWGGHGPRDGWLLLFVDPNQGSPEGSDAFRIVHIDTLGPERATPFDLGPVRDGYYSGASYHYLLPGEEVPNQWRRWPVDLVTVPNEAREENGRTLAAPDNFAQILYEGAEVKSGHELPPPPRPLTFEHALYAVGGLHNRINRALSPLKVWDEFIEELNKDGAIAAFAESCGNEARRRLAEFDAQTVPAATGEAAHRDEVRERREKDVAYYERQAQWLREMRTAEGVLRYFSETTALEQAWQDKLLVQVEAVMTELADHERDTALSQADWGELVATFDGNEFVRWAPDHLREIDGQKRLRFREHRRSAELFAGSAMHELVKDLYLDPDRRHILTPEIIEQYEPHWRALPSNRPHRMGGYHDGLQSDAVIGPTKDLLLFQIASDDAMQWMWGDVGALYFFIRPKHLDAVDFSGVEMSLECH